MEELVRRTQPRLLAAARRIAGATDAEDAVQTAYHSLLRKGEVPRGAPLMAWLFTAVVRIAYRHRATAQREYEIARRLGQEAHGPCEEAEQLALLRHAVDRLPSGYRDAVVLHYLEGLTAAEVGKLVGASETAVWQRLHRARALLRSRLSPGFKHGLMCLPWWSADNAGAAALVLGGVMKGKMAVAGALLLLLGGGVVWEASRNKAPSDRAPNSTSQPSTDPDIQAAWQPYQRRVFFGVRGQPLVTDARRRETDAPKPYHLTDHTGDPSAALLRVLVTDKSERPRAGIEVVLFDYWNGRRRTLIESETDEQGRVSAASVAPGDRKHVAVTDGRLLRTTRIELVAGRATDVTVVVPRTGATLQGVVRHEARGLLPDVVVTLERSADWFVNRLQARTDSAGRYRIEAVPLGDYFVNVEGKSLGDSQRRRIPLVVAHAGVVDQDFLVGHASIRGVVRDATTNKPLPGVPVTLEGPFRTRCTTEIEGVYRFCDLPEGVASLSVAKDGYGHRVLGSISIRADATTSLDLALKPAAVLHIDIRDARGHPVVGRVGFCITDPSPGVWHVGRVHSHVLFTDGTGRVTYRQLAPGAYDLFVFNAQKVGLRSESQRVEVRAGENTVRFQLPGPTPGDERGRLGVTGTVVDATTRLPIVGVRVMALTGPRRFSVTDARGAYGLRGLPSGEHTLHFFKDGYGYHVRRQVKVEEGHALQVDIGLERAAILHLRVTNALGQPVSGRLGLRIDPVAGSEGLDVPTGVTADEKGRATYKQIVPGSYRLQVRARDQGTAVVEAVIQPGENTVEVRLE